MLAIVLATVALGAGPEVSRTCSRFVSVNSSFDGVMLAAGSSNASGGGGVFGISAEDSTGNSGDKPVTSASIELGGGAMESSTEASCVGGA